MKQIAINNGYDINLIKKFWKRNYLKQYRIEYFQTVKIVIIFLRPTKY